jgi:pimeloyl-ACP methyl ester carboxylesterase
MHRRIRLAAVATVSALSVLAAGLAAAPLSANATAATTATTGTTAGRDAIDWGPCPDFGAPTSDLPSIDRLECATVTVPLNYRRPAGETIEVAVSRLPSTNPAKRRGVLLLNPGGPGGPGLELPVLLADAGVSQSVLDSYDLIGFDPRGVRYSSPVSCGFTPEDFDLLSPTYPKGPADVAARAPVVHELMQKCSDAYPDGRLRYFNTASTAKDLDRIRIALGERKISYLGYSYGTYLGAVYTSLFPERSDRFVLDSAVGPEWVWHTEFRKFGLGGELAYIDFAKWAAERDSTYHLGATRQQVYDKTLELFAEADENPDPMFGTFVRWGVFSAIYEAAAYPELAEGLQELDAQNPAAAKATFRRAGLDEPPIDSSATLSMSILCGDAAWPTSVAQYQRDVEVDRRRYPLFGAMMANMWACQAWPFGQLEPTVEINDRGPRNVLILQNFRDPATTYPGAVLMRKDFAKRSKLVSVDQGGHGVYVLTPNTCANDLTTAYLVDGTMPAGDRFCGAEPSRARTAVQKELVRRLR